MATSIPYDPSLVLGNIVHPEAMKILLQIADAQAPIDAAQDELNSLIAMKRSLDMTTQELLNMHIDPGSLQKEIGTVGQQISKAATDYAKVRIDQEKTIKGLKSKQSAVHEDIESPIDYVRTQIKKMPLSSDSLKMDAQYFSFDENKQSAQNTIASIKAFVSESTSFLGDSYSMQASTAASTQVSKQVENHNIEGTLVITASCTHKDAALLAPFVLDVDKAIRVWNSVFPSDNDKIKVNDPSKLAKIALEEGTGKEVFLPILSGATYGSSFVGMVHVLRSETTKSSQQMSSVAASLQGQFEVGCWFANESGGFGVDTNFANDIKNLLSTQAVSSHVSVIAMGAIPSIKSNQVQIGVKQFADFDPAKMMGNLATLANSNSSDKTSVGASAAAARTGKQMMAIQGSTVTNVMLGLSQIDDGSNKMLDVNSLMTAFEDYVTRAIAGDIGVPINYYVKNLSRAQLAQMWVAKYFPDRYLTISGDDTGAGGGKSGAAAQPAPAQADPG
ncbi:hypothetical protein FNU76_19595 [Chitinimonas arctica]|uniref:Uncharacterized protein n=1 Tax=Chitinimonas arctica TaxID=2594795 RepID=A0A516SK37_9NEIS|nr:hypothetical protein [Chitinimonas arctica]QDQ28378.1 hypothetical protein FNU76_19595 [Chitinimonas arctica]